MPLPYYSHDHNCEINVTHIIGVTCGILGLIVLVSSTINWSWAIRTDNWMLIYLPTTCVPLCGYLNLNLNSRLCRLFCEASWTTFYVDLNGFLAPERIWLVIEDSGPGKHEVEWMRPCHVTCSILLSQIWRPLAFLGLADWFIGATTDHITEFHPLIFVVAFPVSIVAVSSGCTKIERFYSLDSVEALNSSKFA